MTECLRHGFRSKIVLIRLSRQTFAGTKHTENNRYISIPNRTTPITPKTENDCLNKNPRMITYTQSQLVDKVNSMLPNRVLLALLCTSTIVSNNYAL